VAGRYKLRFNAYSVWVGRARATMVHSDLDNISKGRRDEPVTITAEIPPRLLRKLGDFDVTPETERARARCVAARGRDDSS
jgi:hypothetical protein